MTNRSAPWYALYPFGGGGATSYRTLIPLLGDHDIHVPQLPGRDQRHREPSHTTFADLVEDLWGQLVEQASTRPLSDLVLFGYSLGGRVAAEMARMVETRTPHTVRCVVVGGSASPARWSHSGISTLSDEAFVERFRTLGIAPPEVLDDPWMVALFMSVWRADTLVAESIDPDPDFRLATRVLALAGDRDPMLQTEDLDSWVELGGPGSEAVTFRGDHGTLIAKPQLAARYLQRAAAGLPTTTAPIR